MTEMCKVQVGHMGILLFSSTKHIPSDNSTFCDTVALYCSCKKCGKEVLKPPYKLRKNLLIMWCLSVRHSSQLWYLMLSDNVETQQTFCSQVPARFPTGKSLQECDTQHEQEYTGVGKFSSEVGISLIYFHVYKRLLARKFHCHQEKLFPKLWLLVMLAQIFF